MAAVTGADGIVAALAEAGVEVVFGLPGVHNLAAWKSLASSPIRLVGVRHEQAAAYAADGYARSSGRVGVALTTTGPGAANTLGAVGEAWASRSPIVVIATDIPTHLRREGAYRGVLHETTDQAAMFAPVTKAVYHVRSADDAGRVVAEAVKTALAPPSRPVYVEIPTDLLSAPASASGASASGASASVAGVASMPAPDGSQLDGSQLEGSQLDAMAEVLGAAKRPLIWAGGGVVHSGAASVLAELASRLAAPVLTTYQARGAVPPDHPCAVGLPPHIPEAGELWDQADVVLVVGSDLDGMSTMNWKMPAPARMLAINVDAIDATKNYPADLLAVGDARLACEGLLGRIGQRDGLESLTQNLAARRQAAFDRLRKESPDAVRFLEVTRAALPTDTTLVLDMCIPGYWLGALHEVAAPRRLAYPVGWGTLGFAYPAALGASLGAPGPVVSISGDGGFLFACGELATMAQERLPFTAVIVDDGGYGMLRFDQTHAGDEPFGVDLVSPDFVAMAESFGLRAEHVDGLGDDFAKALRAHVDDPGPSVLVVSAALDPPPTTSPRWYRN